MQDKKIIITAIFFFLLVNTSYFWAKLPKVINTLIGLALLFTFVCLILVLLVQVFRLSTEKFRVQSRVFTLSVLSFVLIITLLFPFGILDFEKYEVRNVLVAQYEGVAGCTMTIKMKANNRFLEISNCFGRETYTGKYQINADTVRFEYDNVSSANQKFALGAIHLNTQKAGGQFFYFKSLEDRRAISLIIKSFKLE